MTTTAVRATRIADELGELAVRMSTVLLGDRTGHSAIRILTSLALNAVANATGAGVTLIGPDGVPTSLAATSDLVLEADALQDHLNQGPCLDAGRQAVPVRVADLRFDQRWPTWTRAVRPLNIASVMSVPMSTSAEVRGSLNVYCDLPGTFDDRSMIIFDELAHTVASLLDDVSPSGADPV